MKAVCYSMWGTHSPFHTPFHLDCKGTIGKCKKTKKTKPMKKHKHAEANAPGFSGIYCLYTGITEVWP